MAVKFRIVLLSLGCLLGCSEGKFAQYRVIPDARFRVHFAQEIYRDQVFETTEELAQSMGFRVYLGNGLNFRFDGPVREGQLETHRYSYGQTWVQAGHPGSQHLSFRWLISPEQLDFVDVYYVKDESKHFTEVDWSTMGELVHSAIPRYFNGSNIEVTDHPATHTRLADILRFSESSGIALKPEDEKTYYETYGNPEVTQIDER